MWNECVLHVLHNCAGDASGHHGSPAAQTAATGGKTREMRKDRTTGTPNTPGCSSGSSITSGAGQGEAEPNALSWRGGLRSCRARAKSSAAASHKAADDRSGALKVGAGTTSCARWGSAVGSGMRARSYRQMALRIVLCAQANRKRRRLTSDALAVRLGFTWLCG